MQFTIAFNSEILEDLHAPTRLVTNILFRTYINARIGAIVHGDQKFRMGTSNLKLVTMEEVFSVT